MAKRGSAELSISQLETILAERQARLKELMDERDKAQTHLSSINAEIAVLSGTRSGTGRRRGRPPGSGKRRPAVNGAARGRKRPRNESSLVQTLEKVLGEAGKPLGVGEIVDAVLASGYKSSSPTFRAIVNQTLIKEKKRFASAGRGVYQLKK
jgi:hypothetical protein